MSARTAYRATLASLALSVTACSAELESDQVGAASAALARTGTETFVVVYRAEAVPSSARSDIAKAGGTLVASYPELGLLVARASRAHFASTLAKSALIESVAATSGAGIDSLATQTSTSSLRTTPHPASSGEPLAAMQWNMRQVRAAEARAITPGRKSVIVGVLDSGIDDSVPDLVGQVDAGRSVSCVGGAADSARESWSHDDIGHGTHVAGIIAGKENGRGIVGIAPGVTLAAVKLTDDGFVYPEAFLCGVYWAATHGFDLVNASLFVDPWYYNCDSDPTQRALTVAQRRAVKFAMKRGVTVIAAASNEGQDLANKSVDPLSPTDGEAAGRVVDSSCKLLPVELDGVIGVSAVDGQKNLAYYSNYGLGVVDLAAPGGDLHVPVPGNDSGQIVSSVPSYSYYYQFANDWNGRVGIGCSDGLDPNDPKADPESCAETYALLQGTSQATPHVTGIAALAISRFGKLTPAQLHKKLAQTATQRSCPSVPYLPYPDEMEPAVCQGTLAYNGFFGAGIVDALRAVR